MKRTAFILRRTLQSVPVLLGLSGLIFIIARVAPGDPVAAALGPTASQEQIQEFRRELGLNEPIHVQYIDWITGVLQGNWGMSLQTYNNVFHDIAIRFAATLELVVVSLLFAIVFAIPLGMIAGTHKDRWPDHLSRVLAFFGVSMPRFWIAILFQVIFVAWLGILPLTGRLSSGVEAPPTITGLFLIDSLVTGQWATFVDAAKHILLPAVALGLSSLARIARYIRSDVVEELRKDYVLASQSYGLPRSLIEYKYILKNSFSSSLTIIGLDFGFLMGNAFLVEIVFVWPGMAKYGVNAILFSDTNAIIGITMVIGVIYVGTNLLVDLLYGYLDPRIVMEGD
ncbi:ABC transporter permease [Halorussus sp. AFM4]|uniref:ABC transporter permease n=1 Tax=Halorussus sp. AFM4 TaxID=3421651 RepID=UPI003EB76F75